VPTFTVLAHTQPELVARLCRRLSPFHVIIHVDKSVDLAPFRYSVADFADRITFVNNRIRIAWGGFSIVQATVNLYREALKCTDPAEHIVLLSGQCYPTRPIEEFAVYLYGSEHRQHCHAVPLIHASHHYHRKITRRHFLDLMTKQPVRRLPSNDQRVIRRTLGVASRVIPGNELDERILYGSQWTAFTAECIDEMLRIADSAGWATFFRRSYAPDEMFFHTILHQSRFSHEAPFNGPGRFEVDGIFAQANFHLIDRSLNRTFVLKDRSEIGQSNKYFVRKVRLPESSSLLDAVDSGSS
jgi:Core-2/I-Branching enzyme